MSKVKQTKQDLMIHLKDHCDFLEVSARAFDEGFIGEAKRMATTLRVLLHDTRSSHSLLSQLKLKSKMRYLNTAHPFDERNLVSHHGLVGLRVSGTEGTYYAHLDNAPHRAKLVTLPEWWNETVICDSKKNKFNRRELILNLANKDGGAHVDPELTENYADLSRNNSVGWVFSDGHSSEPMLGVELYSLRQISYEFLVSIKRKLPQLFE